MDTKVISLGGSIVAPSDVDIELLRDFSRTVTDYLEGDERRRLILVVGGGGPARTYQDAYRKAVKDIRDDMQDWIGISATRLNAQLLAGVFQDYCPDPVVTDPTAEISFTGRILIAAGWKPGFSTDFDAVKLAERYDADTVINLSNIKKVYTRDPKQNPDAEALDNVSWSEFRKIVGDKWVPGKNLPFDPVAAKRSSELHLRVIVASGREIETVEAVLENRPFEGTIIGPE